MQRPPVPGSVTLGQVLLIIESVLWLLAGLAVAGFGVLVFTAVANINNRLAQIGYTGTPFTTQEAGAVGGTLVVVGVVILIVAIIGIWSGAAMGRLTGGPRATAIVLACLGLVIGIFSVIGGLHRGAAVTTGTTTLRDTPIPGIVIVVVNLLIIWAVGFARSARAAFRSLPTAAYPMTAPAGYGPGTYSPGTYGSPLIAPVGQVAVPGGASAAPPTQADATQSFPPPPPPPPPPPGDFGFAAPSGPPATAGGVPAELSFDSPPAPSEAPSEIPELSFEAPAAPVEAPDAPVALSFETSAPAPEAVGSEAPAGLGFDDAPGAAAAQPPDAPPAADPALAGEMAAGIPTDYPPPPPAPKS